MSRAAHFEVIMFRLLKDIIRHRPVSDPTLTIAEAAYVVVDTELTGLDERRDSIVSIGAVRMDGGRIDIGDTFYRIMSPRTELRPSSVVIHEITPSEVREKPEISSVLKEFLDFCDDRIIVGHCVTIDLDFLNREIKLASGHPMRNRAADTAALVAWLRKRSPEVFAAMNEGDDYRLYSIARAVGIQVQAAHRALMDAFITAQLFQRLIPVLGKAGVLYVDDLLRIGDPYKGGDSFRSPTEICNF